MIKNIKSLFLIIISTILISSCGSVQKAFDPQNKNTSEEFLVEKKSPLSMPPSFEELPSHTAPSWQAFSYPLGIKTVLLKALP